MDGAKQAIEQFCQAEFDGVLNIRLDTARYSRARMLKEQQRDPDFAGLVIYCDNDPLHVVSSFHIESTLTQGTHAIAWVSFNQLASTRGDGQEARMLIRDPKNKDVVRYDLRKSHGKWWVLDPPTPRVSRDGLIAAYQMLLRTVPPHWLDSPEVTEAQKKVVRKQMEDLAFLQGLPPS